MTRESRYSRCSRVVPVSGSGNHSVPPTPSSCCTVTLSTCPRNVSRFGSAASRPIDWMSISDCPRASSSASRCCSTTCSSAALASASSRRRRLSTISEARTAAPPSPWLPPLRSSAVWSMLSLDPLGPLSCWCAGASTRPRLALALRVLQVRIALPSSARLKRTAETQRAQRQNPEQGERALRLRTAQLCPGAQQRDFAPFYEFFLRALCVSAVHTHHLMEREDGWTTKSHHPLRRDGRDSPPPHVAAPAGDA